MRVIIFAALLCTSVIAGNAQSDRTLKTTGNRVQERYVTFNPLALAESPVAVGAGYGNRFTERSEFFAELSYTAKGLFYKNIESMNGIRVIGQYRYHFLQRWRPIPFFQLHPDPERHNPFMAFEFRFKQFRFSDKHNFINEAVQDTLRNIEYSAGTTVYGGAVLFGSTYNISQNGKWKLEFSAGIGARQRNVNVNTPKQGYTIYHVPPKEWGLIPQPYETRGLPYFPLALRIRYLID